MKAYGGYSGRGVKVTTHFQLVPRSRKCGSIHPLLGERTPGTHWIGGWVDLRSGLDDVEKRKFLTLPGLELRPLGRPASS
jgi:hypothetical protein